MKISPLKGLPLLGATILSSLALGGSPASAAIEDLKMCIGVDDEETFKVLVVATSEVRCDRLKVSGASLEEDRPGRGLERWNYCVGDHAEACATALNDIATLYNKSPSVEYRHPYEFVLRDTSDPDLFCVEDDHSLFDDISRHCARKTDL